MLCGAIVWLAVGFRRNKVRHQEKTAWLRSEMRHISINNQRQEGKLMVSIDMERKMMAGKQQLNQELLLLQHDLIGTLVKNNLVE